MNRMTIFRKVFSLRVLAMASVAVTSVASLLMAQNASTLQKLGSVQEGVTTCFGRVAQSYTSKMLGQKSSVYLDQSFVSSTGECFADLLSLYDQSFSKMNAGLLQLLNKSSKMSYEFHSKLTGKNNVFVKNEKSVVLSNLDSRYQKIEASQVSIQGQLENLRAGLESRNTMLKYILWAFATLSMLILALIFQKESSQNEEKEEIDLEAANLNLEHEMTPNQVYSIVSKALEHEKYDNLASKFQEVFTDATPMGMTTMPVHTIQADNKEDFENQVDQIWDLSNESDKAKESFVKKFSKKQRDSFDLEEALTETIDALSSKIFTLGVAFDFNMDEEIRVNANLEDFAQIAYYLTSNRLDYCSKENGPRVQIDVKRLGGIALVDFVAVGHQFSHDEILELNKIGSKEPVESRIDDINLKIAKVLATSVGKISFENIDKPGISKVQLILEVEKPAKRLVSVQKGKKKDLKRRLQAGL